MRPRPPRTEASVTPRRSFEAAYLAHHDALRRYVGRRIHPDDVDDVVGQTFATAWRRRDAQPGDPVLHRAWLLRIAGYEILNHRRGRRRRLALHERVAMLTTAQAAVHHDLPRLRGELLGPASEALLDQLDAHDRALLGLVAWCGVDLREAADLLGCSHEAARARLHRLRRRSQAFLDDLSRS